MYLTEGYDRCLDRVIKCCLYYLLLCYCERLKICGKTG